MATLNCWDYKKCGRQPGGAKVAELGICPASTMVGLSGCNSGTNAGRACWAVTGTLCGGKVQGVFAEKLGNCTACEFFKLVAAEEGTGYKSSRVILERLKVLKG